MIKSQLFVDVAVPLYWFKCFCGCVILNTYKFKEFWSSSNWPKRCGRQNQQIATNHCKIKQKSDCKIRLFVSVMSFSPFKPSPCQGHKRQPGMFGLKVYPEANESVLTCYFHCLCIYLFYLFVCLFVCVDLLLTIPYTVYIGHYQRKKTRSFHFEMTAYK